MAEAPRPVPPYAQQQIANLWFYCLHCRKSEATDYAMRQHARYYHLNSEGDPIYGEDYTNGEHLKIMQARWEEWSLKAVDRFAVALESLRGADDFEMEVGDGLPE